MKNADVTIILPIYNEAEHLSETLDSIIQQTYPNIQIYISDNASTDNSLSIAESYAEKDSRIKVFKQPKNVAASENFNFLINRSDTEYTSLIGGHDLLKEDCIECCKNKMNLSDSISCVFPKASYFGKANKLKSANSNIDLYTDSKFLRVKKVINNLKAGTALYSMYRTAVLQKIIIKPIRGADLWWLVQIANTGSIISTDSVLYLRREDRIENKYQKKKRYIKSVGLSQDQYKFDSVILNLCNFINSELDIPKADRIYLSKLVIRKYQSLGIVGTKSLLKMGEYNSVKRALLTEYFSNVPYMLYRDFNRKIRNFKAVINR